MPHSLVDRIDEWQTTIFVWLPEPFFGIFVLLCASVVAVALWYLAYRSLNRFAGNRWTFIGRLLPRIRRVSRLAVIIFVISAALPATGFPPETSALIAKILFVCFILLVGWCAILASNIGSEIYLRRFRMDVDDNLFARKQVTQVNILKRAANTLIVVITIATALMLFESVRQYGVSLLASAGAAGLIVGFAARPLLANLIAGVQIAITQPIRVDDAVVVEGEWGWIEEITSTYVVVKIWDWRRLILPLSYFIEHPFQNWTRSSASIIGTVFLHVDYKVPVQRIRDKLTEFAEASPLWDRQVVNLQVTEAKEHTVEIRALVSASTSPKAWDLRCEIREKLLDFLQSEFPDSLPRRRVQLESDPRDEPKPGTPAPMPSPSTGERQPPAEPDAAP